MLKNILKFVFCWFLCGFYSALVGIVISIIFTFKFYTRFWIPKSRPFPPKCLDSSDYGEHKFAQVNGIKLHYVAKGDPTRPLIIFVHGFPEFWYSWRYQIKEFSRDYYTVAIDLRGFGYSEKPEKYSDYHVDKLVEDIKQFSMTFGKEKFTLICHDWGACIGFDYVQKHMDTLDKYVMIGGPPGEVWNNSIFSSVKQFLMSWYVFFYLMPFLPEFCLRLFDLDIFKIMESASGEDMEAYKYTFGRDNAFTGPINFYRENVRFLFPNPPIPRPTKFVPGLYMLGENDIYISKETGEIAKKMFKRLDFKVIEGANHFSQSHKPEITNRLIREFLSKK